jgi:uncharacterized RDD family membrane protein YckC
MNEFEPIPVYDKASAGSRLVAVVIDILISYIPVALLFILMGFTGYQLGGMLALVYNLVKDAVPALNGQSLGKRAMNIRVVNYETGNPITGDYGASAIRAVSLMIPLLNVIEFILVIADHNGRRIGDKWAKTIVVRNKS